MSANPRISDGAVTVAAAIELLGRLRGLGDHAFWDDSISIVTSDHVPRDRMHGHRQVTDGHLVALARAHGGRLVTFDKGLVDLAGDDGPVTLLRQ